jgi:urease accessory protein
MPRATKILAAGQHRDTPITDTLILNLDQRRIHSGHVFTGNGMCIELDLEAPVWLRTDDALVLEDGRLIEVVAEAEPLLEVRATDLPALARIAWILGDRHVPVQILGNRLWLRRDTAMRELLLNLAVKVTEIEAPFDPEGGAYLAAARDHVHHHHHGHEHAHEHHEDDRQGRHGDHATHPHNYHGD